MSHRVAVNFSDGHTVFFEANHNEILLDAAFRNGLTLSVDCREGVCGTCKGVCELGQYEQDYVDEDALTESELNSRHILSCQTRVLSPSAFYYDIDSSLCSKKEPLRFQAKVTRIEKVAESSANLHLDIMDPEFNLDYLAGQYARIEVPTDGVWRSYSFATASNGSGNLQFLIRLLPEGVMSEYIREHCQVGDELTLEAPMGSFYLRELKNRQVFVAGGTGLSAFLAMLDEIVVLQANKDTVYAPLIELFYCVNNERELCELERIERYQTQLPNFQYHLVVKQPSEEGYEGKKGLITEVLDTESLKESVFDMYICGPPPMVEAVRGWLLDNKIDNGKLYFEKFVASSSSR